jgi:hypothetical protein
MKMGRRSGSCRASAVAASRGACLACEAVVSRGIPSCTPKLCRLYVRTFASPPRERGITASLLYP